MAVVQSTYSENISRALPGMPADADYSADTRIVETEAGIAFGVATSQGANDNGALVGAAAAADFVGVSIRDKTVPDGTDKYADGANIGVMTRGDIWVTVGGDVVAGDDVTFVATTGVLSSAGTSGSQFAITGARWMTSASNGALALLRLGGALPSA